MNLYATSELASPQPASFKGKPTGQVKQIRRAFIALGHSGMCGRNGNHSSEERSLPFNKGIIECLDNMKRREKKKSR